LTAEGSRPRLEQHPSRETPPLQVASITLAETEK